MCLLLLHLFVVCTVNKLLKNCGSGLSFLGRKLKQFVQLLNYALRKLVKHYFLTVWVSWKRAASKQIPTVSPPSSLPPPPTSPPTPTQPTPPPLDLSNCAKKSPRELEKKQKTFPRRVSSRRYRWKKNFGGNLDSEARECTVKKQNH